MFILLAVSLNEADQASYSNYILSWGHNGKNTTPDTDSVKKDDVRYTLAMYMSVECMYLINWFMWGADALDYYIPEEEKIFEYEIAPIED